MQSVGMIGVERKSLLAAEQRIKVSPGSHMRKPGLMERRGIAGVGTLQSRLGFSGGYPAVATVHRHISMGAAHQPLDDSPPSINRFGRQRDVAGWRFADLM
jgi:hypothetical protein